MTIASSESLQVIYTAASYNFQEVHNLLKFSSKYEFLTTLSIPCGKVLYNSSTGGSSHRSCQKRFSIPNKLITMRLCYQM